VDSNDYLNEAVESAMEIQEEMKEILNELDDINNKLENAGLQLNLYINNVLKMKKPFDFTKHIIIFDDNNDLYFYDHKIVEKHIVTSEDIDIDHSKILELLPKQEGYKLAPKQFKKALDMINEYNKLALQYECNLVEFETDGEEYEEIMDAVRKELSSIKLIDISKGDYN
ncbi:MAG: hypothetical protein N2485_08780, partial [bacterium]|nr:hypothetical protein [bacterium]